MNKNYKRGIYLNLILGILFSLGSLFPMALLLNQTKILFPQYAHFVGAFILTLYCVMFGAVLLISSAIGFQAIQKEETKEIKKES